MGKGDLVTLLMRLTFDPPEEPPPCWTDWLRTQLPVLDEFPRITGRPLFGSLDFRTYVILRSIAVERDHFYDEHERPMERSILRYMVLDCPRDIDFAVLRRNLDASGKVEFSYVEAGTPLSAGGSVNVRLLCSEGHLEAAPEGVDARYAWGFAGGDGIGVRVIDVESGWAFFDRDLSDAVVTLSSGLNVPEGVAHGTAVLGIIAAARNNGIGTNGIAPGVSSVRVVSIQRNREVENISDAIMSAVAEARFGDVLLLELQARHDNRPFRPIETEPAVFEVIRLATALGVIVIEPAGNGGTNLDRIGSSQSPDCPMLDRNQLETFRDSGAILVSASRREGSTESGHPWNYGGRVDCYSWGDGIYTLSIYSKRSEEVRRRWLDARALDPDFEDIIAREELFPEDPPRIPSLGGNFPATSAASAVIAGVAVSVQGMAQALLGYRFSPWQLRLILSDVMNGSQAPVPQKGNIGVMPDLKRITREVLRIPADIYLRDRLGDTGECPRARRMESPDIIVRQDRITNPNKFYGEGSGREDDDLMLEGLRLGSPSRVNVYLRLRNRGGREAEGVCARIFCTPASTLLVLSLMKEIGRLTFLSVPEAEQLTVSEPIECEIPAFVPALDTGLWRAWVGVIDNSDDPGPNLEKASADWDYFVSVIQADNNFSCRNFHSVPHAWGEGEGNADAWTTLPFLVAGAPDRTRVMRIEVLSSLPRSCKVWIDMPREFSDVRQVSSIIFPLDIADKDRVRLPINPNGRHYLRESLLSAGCIYRLRLFVHVPLALRLQPYRIAVRQIWQGVELGRVSWRLMPPERN